jgi:homoserine kinase type II
MTIFYIVFHENPASEDVKCVGVYSSEALAEAAVARVSLQPGFRDAPECFSIDPYRLDRDHWQEGFGID